MATLTGSSVASTYTTLLKLTTASLGADASGKYIEDASGTDSALSLSTTRVGIGTATPDSNLHIYSATNEDPDLIIEHVGSAGQDGGNLHFKLRESSGFINDGQEIGDIQWMSYDNTDDNYNNSAMIRVTASGTQAQNRAGAEMSFWTNNDSTGTTEVLTINSKGNVGIGTSSFQAASVGYMAIKNGTSPGALTADQVYIGARDSAGTGTDTLSTLSIFTEEAVDATALDAVGTLTTRIPIWVNDVAYWLYLDPV